MVKVTLGQHPSCEYSLSFCASTSNHSLRIVLGKMITRLLGLVFHVSTGYGLRFIAQNKNILSNEEACMLSNAQQLTYLDETYVTDVRSVFSIVVIGATHRRLLASMETGWLSKARDAIIGIAASSRSVAALTNRKI